MCARATRTNRRRRIWIQITAARQLREPAPELRVKLRAIDKPRGYAQRYWSGVREYHRREWHSVRVSALGYCETFREACGGCGGRLWSLPEFRVTFGIRSVHSNSRACRYRLVRPCRSHFDDYSNVYNDQNDIWIHDELPVFEFWTKSAHVRNVIEFH